MMRLITLAIAAVALAAPAGAQNASRDKDDIVVRAQREKEVEAFVKALTNSRDGRQLARWNGRICLKIVGLWPERAAKIAERIGTIASQLDISYKTAPGCEPNTIIAFTGQADKFTAQMLDAVPALISDAEQYGLPPKTQIARYLAPRPVRWFAINATTMADGNSVGSMNRDGPGSADGSPNINAAPSSIAASRLRARTRENTGATLIVVDEGKLGGIKWSQLADYLAMVSLAQPAIDADFAGTDSVMAIFAARDAGGAGPAGLTTQDDGFLKGLYRSGNNLSPSQQRGVIGDTIKKGRAR